MHSRASWAPHGARRTSRAMRELRSAGTPPITIGDRSRRRAPASRDSAALQQVLLLFPIGDRSRKEGACRKDLQILLLFPIGGRSRKRASASNLPSLMCQRHVATIAWILRLAASGLPAGGSLMTSFSSQQPACMPVGASWARSPRRSRPARRWELDVHLLLARRPACTPLG